MGTLSRAPLLQLPYLTPQLLVPPLKEQRRSFTLPYPSLQHQPLQSARVRNGAGENPGFHLGLLFPVLPSGPRVHRLPDVSGRTRVPIRDMTIRIMRPARRDSGEVVRAHNRMASCVMLHC